MAGRAKHELDWSSFTCVPEPKGKNVEQDFLCVRAIDSGSSHQGVRERVKDYNDRSDFRTPMSLSTTLSSLGPSFYYCWLSLRKRQWALVCHRGLHRH